MKKLITMLLALAMITCMIPAFALSVWADGVENIPHGNADSSGGQTAPIGTNEGDVESSVIIQKTDEEGEGFEDNEQGGEDDREENVQTGDMAFIIMFAAAISLGVLAAVTKKRVNVK